MLFNSLNFAVFYIAVFCLYWTIPRLWKKPLLVFASYFFYGVWDYRFVGLLLLTATIDFFCARLIYRNTLVKTKKVWLLLSITANLVVLGFFKYFNFFADTLSRLLGFEPWGLSIILPIGISFYTFQSMSYTIDVYRGSLKPAPAVDYFLFVSFFPQLIAGPIVRASQFLPQLDTDTRFTLSNTLDGATIFLQGFVKKVLFADVLARSIDPIFQSPHLYSSLYCLFAVYGFAFQIYWDFSGYTDMARGAARMLGYELPINFNLPYLSRSFRDFWRRWHISLSTWLKDYLYISLGGNRGGTFKVMRNLLITMLLGGLWHGAHWNFVLWGAFHGSMLAAERALAPIAARIRVIHHPLISILRQIITFHLICAGWILFRCPTLTKAREIGSAILQSNTGGHDIQPVLLIAVCLFALWHLLSGLTEKNIVPRRFFMPLRSILGGAGVALAFIYSTTGAPFLYFQF